VHHHHLILIVFGDGKPLGVFVHLMRLKFQKGAVPQDVRHSPVIPAALQPIAVSALVGDPQGINSVTLKYARIVRRSHAAQRPELM